MTENLAGRGEGLAGLVAELTQVHPLPWKAHALMIRDARGAQVIHLGGSRDEFGRGIEGDWLVLLNKLIVAALAALDEHPFFKYAHMCRDGHEQIGHNDSSSEMCPLCRALATPSPQAPQEQSNAFSPTSAREQSSATASGNQGTGDGYLDTHLAGRIAARLDEYEFVAQMVSGVRKEDWFKRRIADLEARYKRAAATQEQPAGSAPSGSTRPNVYTIQEVSMGRRAKNCNCGETPCMCKMFEEEMKLEEAEQKEAETGSPRKVGEDGVGELKVGDVVLVEATISGVSRFEDGQVSGEDLLHLRVANGHGSIVRRCVARPSSVPVGEQKQEEGV